MKRTESVAWGLASLLHPFSRAVDVNLLSCLLEKKERVMASSVTTHRAVCAGLSCGIGLAVPVVAYAASLPFGDMSEYVAAGALPFAVGAVAGVGIYAASLKIADRGAARADDVSPEAMGTRSDETEERRSGFFSRAHAVDPDVPVIARADNGISEDDAWAMIDAMTESSSVSCDPADSRDVYQIAIDELSQASETGQLNRDDIAAAARAAAGVSTAPAGTTAQFIALASAAAATATIPVEPEDEQNTDAARDAALASLMQPQSAVATSQIPTIDDGDSAPTEQVESVLPAAAQLVDSTASMQPDTVGEDDLLDPDDEDDIPMFDYSGHEDMWASALAILSEEDAPADEPLSEEPVYIGRHSKSAVASTQPNAVPVTPERVEAVAEGARATEMHTKVNQMLEEEIDKVDSKSVRHTSREYLKVIQGGTMSMPRLRAEA